MGSLTWFIGAGICAQRTAHVPQNGIVAECRRQIWKGWFARHWIVWCLFTNTIGLVQTRTHTLVCVTSDGTCDGVVTVKDLFRFLLALDSGV